jgi:hypothetical protein
MSMLERQLNYAAIVSCGDFLETLYPKINYESVAKKVLDYGDVHGWYERVNPGVKGLSIVNRDGSPISPSVDSIRSYNKENGTNYLETDFRKKTELFDLIVDDIPLLKDAEKYLCRSHFINMRAGGIFPPHHDGLDAFRIVIPIWNTGTNDFKWGFEDRILSMQEGKSYFLNTLKNHWVVSFTDDCLLLLLNIEPTPEACYWLWDTALGGRNAPKRRTRPV